MHRVGRSWLLLVLLLAGGGCGKGAPKEDLEWARGTVDAALNAWKKGEPPAVLQKQTPPIQFLDPDWQQALVLRDYEFVNLTAQENGVLRCHVRLSVQDRQGKRVDKEVVYLVDRAKGAIGRDPYS